MLAIGINASFIYQIDLETSSRISTCEWELYRTREASVWWDVRQQLLSLLSPVPHLLLFLISTSLTVESNMQNRTDTLEIGSRAPDFSLGAANREGAFTLGGLLAEGTLILEFLRGTW
jgi:hypothetical protein